MAGAAPEELVTLQQAADRLGLHYMTVYRYVRTGRLPGHKVGAEWRVDPADLAAFESDGTPPPATSRRTDHGRRLFDRLVAGDERGAWTVVQSALASGLDPDALYLRVIAPALTTIGDRWAEGAVSVGEEHQATVVVQRLIGRLGPMFTRRGRTRGTVVLGAPPGDSHSLPSSLFADLLRGEGLGVVDLGADTPIDSFVDAALQADRLVAVAISVTTPGNEAAVLDTVDAVRRAVAVPVVVGGGAVRSPLHATALGSAAYAGHEPEALELFSRLADEASRSRRLPRHRDGSTDG